MKKELRLFIWLGIIFLPLFLYLHQKVLICVEAYELSKNYKIYHQLISKRDSLKYNFTKNISLVKLNEWLEKNNFSFAKKERTIALHPEKKSFIYHKNKISKIFNRFLNIPAKIPPALAEEKK
ncbi:MAG TPA: hypothetical protein EYP89_00310 [Candidatus Omnitrophica bacterium]|nr:hypothetical protein [Candidatus Omnitrophota bacterium]